MQSTMSQADFEKGMQSIRNPLGKMVSRDLKSQKHKTSLPGLPDGDYWVVSYNATFENKQMLQRRSFSHSDRMGVGKSRVIRCHDTCVIRSNPWFLSPGMSGGY